TSGTGSGGLPPAAGPVRKPAPPPAARAFPCWLAGALDFNVEKAREDFRPLAGAALAQRRVAIVDCRAAIAEMGARQGNEVARLQFLQPFAPDFRAPAMQVGQPGPGQQFTYLQVTGTVLHQQQQARRLVPVAIVGDPG